MPPLPLSPSPALPVHYVGRLAESGEIFMDTRKESQSEEPEEIVAGRGALWGWRRLSTSAACARSRCLRSPASMQGTRLLTTPRPQCTPSPASTQRRCTDSAYREVGINLAAAAMSRGERARVWAAPALGYGPQGSFSFPTVPPNARLV